MCQQKFKKIELIISNFWKQIYNITKEIEELLLKKQDLLAKIILICI
jgi:hypothetical protein